MFKSKIDFNAFDTNNKKVKNLEQPKVKALGKAGVKKLLAQPDTRTPFHLILDYFKDNAEKPMGHFIGFGTNKKMDKHFQQVELKSGKLEQSMSASQKEAAMGEAYVKEENGKKILCLEPSANVKVPKGRWAKIIKGLKPYLSGAKAVVVFNGEIIGEEEEPGEVSTEETGKEDTSTETASTAPEEDNTTTTEESTGTTAPQGEDIKALVEQFKAQLNEIGNGLKQTLPKEVIPKIKARTVAGEDLEIVQGIKSNIEEFEQAFQNAADNLQSKLSKMRDSIAQQAPKVDQIIQAIEKLLGGNTGTDTGTDQEQEEDVSAIQALLDLAQQGLDNFNSNFDQLKKELEQSTSEPLPSGDAFLETIE